MKTKNFKKKLPALVVGTMLLAGGLRVPNTFAAQGLPAGPVENNIEGRVLVVAQDGSGQFTPRMSSTTPAPIPVHYQDTERRWPGGGGVPTVSVVL